VTLTSLDAAHPRAWYFARLRLPRSGALETPRLEAGEYLLGVGGHTCRVRVDGSAHSTLDLTLPPPLKGPITPRMPTVALRIRGAAADEPWTFLFESVERPEEWGYLASPSWPVYPRAPGAYRASVPAGWWWPFPTEGAERAVHVPETGHQLVEMDVAPRR
jgi:hypothetical protein